MKKKCMYLTLLCGILLISSISLADSVDEEYKRTEIEIEREESDFSVYSLPNLKNKFRGWGEEKSKIMYPGKFNEYRRFQKRAVASSVGYNGNHYLRAYVELFKSKTDTDRVTRSGGFTLRSKWAYMRDYAVPGRARAFYGID
ncbi:MAG: hypothetical protein ACTHW2_07425 [Tissierella sp.]|uniref:hypothetical protein n=1 Tax=Tissierella sp. TaxID=41274 RepID=UPI003F9D83E0